MICTRLRCFDSMGGGDTGFSGSGGFAASSSSCCCGKGSVGLSALQAEGAEAAPPTAEGRPHAAQAGGRAQEVRLLTISSESPSGTPRPGEAPAPPTHREGPSPRPAPASRLCSQPAWVQSHRGDSGEHKRAAQPRRASVSSSVKPGSLLCLPDTAAGRSGRAGARTDWELAKASCCYRLHHGDRRPQERPCGLCGQAVQLRTLFLLFLVVTPLGSCSTSPSLAFLIRTRGS